MRAYQNIWIVLIILLTGVHLSATEPEELAKGLPGTYTMPAIGSGDIEMTIELSKDGHWSWKPKSQVDNSSHQSGTWFVYHQILVLRIEKTGMGEVPEGFAMTWDIRRVNTDGIVLYDLWKKKEGRGRESRLTNRCSQRGAALWVYREAAGCFVLQFPRG